MVNRPKKFWSRLKPMDSTLFPPCEAPPKTLPNMPGIMPKMPPKSIPALLITACICKILELKRDLEKLMLGWVKRTECAHTP